MLSDVLRCLMSATQVQYRHFKEFGLAMRIGGNTNKLKKKEWAVRGACAKKSVFTRACVRGRGRGSVLMYYAPVQEYFFLLLLLHQSPKEKADLRQLSQEPTPLQYWTGFQSHVRANAAERYR